MGLFLPSEVARLVLGYLEEEECEKAYEEFLSSSPHLQECRETNRNLGFFSMGCSLVDILEDYSAVNNFVLNFHSTKTLKRQISKCHTLLEKIKFICKKDDTSVEEKKDNDMNRLSICDNSEKCSIGSKADYSFNVNTTPASDLPGHIPTSSRRDDFNKNISVRDQTDELLPSKEIKKIIDKSISEDGRTSVEEAAFKKALGLVKLSDITDKSIQSKTPTKRKLLKYKGSQSARKLTDGADTFPNESINVTAITSALLDYTELHEKIAENINNLIASTSMKSLEKSNFADNGLIGDQNNVPFIVEDETTQMNNVIKSIVDKTEKDPLFDQFLNDVLDNIAPAHSTSGSDSDTISRPETSTPEKSAPSFAEDSSPTPINHFLLDDESYKSFNKKCRNKYSKGKGKCLTNMTDNLQSNNTNQPKFVPRLSRGGKRMDLLQENYKNPDMSDSNDNSLDSLSNDNVNNTIITIPLEPEPNPIIAEPVVQEKPGKVKIISNEQVQTNVTDKGKLIIQKCVPTDAANFKSIQLVENYSVGAPPLLENPIPQPFFIVDSKPPEINIGPSETIKTSSNTIPSQTNSNSSTQTLRQFRPQRSDLIILNSGVSVADTKLKLLDNKFKPQACNIVAPLPSVVPGPYVETIKPQLKSVDDIKVEPKIQTGPFESIIIIDGPGINISNPLEIAKASILSLPDTQINIKTPNAPTSNNFNSSSGTRKSASHVRVLDFNDAKRESKKELVKKAFMSPVRILESNKNKNKNKKSPFVKQIKNPINEGSPISILNKDIDKNEIPVLSEVWSDTLGLNQIIKPSKYACWDANLRAAVEPDIAKTVTQPKKVQTKKTPKKITAKAKREDKIFEKHIIKPKDDLIIDEKPMIIETNFPENNEEAEIHKKEVEPKTTQKKNELVPVCSKSIPSAEKPKTQVNSIFSMNTLLETPIKPNFFDISINTPKFFTDKSISISAIKIDEITTPFFKKTPDGLMASLFGTPGTGSTICHTDYSSSSSYYKPDEIEDLYFTKDNESELDKTSIVKDSSPKKDTELEKENISDRVLRPRRKSTKYANFVTATSSKNTPNSKSALSKSSDSEKSFVSVSDKSFTKMSKSSSKNKNKPLKPKDEPENILAAKNSDGKIISPQTHRQLLSEKANRVKSKLNTIKPTISKTSSIFNRHKKIMSQNRTTKLNSTPAQSKKTKDANDKKMADVRTKENSATSKDDQKNSNNKPSLLPLKSRRKSSTPRKLEKVDTPVSPQTDSSPPKKLKKENEPVQKTVNLLCDEHFPTLNINMYSSETGENDSEDDFIGVKKFIYDGKDISFPKPIETYKSTREQIKKDLTDVDEKDNTEKPIKKDVLKTDAEKANKSTEQQIEKDLADSNTEKTKGNESPTNDLSLEDSDHVIIWSEYDINSSHPKYIQSSHDNKHQKKKLTDAHRREIRNYVLNAGIFNTLHDCDEERAIAVSNVFDLFDLRSGYKPKRIEKRKRDVANDEQTPKISKPKTSGLQLLMNEFTKSGDAMIQDSPNSKKELDVAVKSIMDISDDHSFKDIELESPKKVSEEKKNETTPDISSSKKLLTQFGIDSVLSMLHGPDQT